MTENKTEPTADEMETATTTDGVSTPDPIEPTANKEAAKYRHRLREAETERDAANERVETLAKQLIELHLPRHIKPEAFWKLTDAAPADYLTDDGIDRERINADAIDAANVLGLRNPARGPVVSSQRGSEGPSGNARNGFAAAFAPQDDG